MDCCKPKETMPGPKEEPEGGLSSRAKMLIAALLTLTLIGGFVLVLL